MKCFLYLTAFLCGFHGFVADSFSNLELQLTGPSNSIEVIGGTISEHNIRIYNTGTTQSVQVQKVRTSCSCAISLEELFVIEAQSFIAVPLQYTAPLNSGLTAIDIVVSYKTKSGNEDEVSTSSVPVRIKAPIRINVDSFVFNQDSDNLRFENQGPVFSNGLFRMALLND